MGNLVGVLATIAACVTFYWSLYVHFCRPRHACLKFSELPAALLICLCGRRYRRHLAGGTAGVRPRAFSRRCPARRSPGTA